MNQYLRPFFYSSESTVPATPEVSAESENPVTVDVSKKDVPVTGIKLDKKKVKVGVTGKYRLTAKMLPGDATNKKLTWTTSDKKIAEVTSNGLVKAKKIGDCVITITSKDGSFKAECKVTVTKKVKVEGVKLNKTKKNLTAGDKFTLKATLKPKKVTNQDVKWSSSNTKVATVDANSGHANLYFMIFLSYFMYRSKRIRGACL